MGFQRVEKSRQSDVLNCIVFHQQKLLDADLYEKIKPLVTQKIGLIFQKKDISTGSSIYLRVTEALIFNQVVNQKQHFWRRSFGLEFTFFGPGRETESFI